MIIIWDTPYAASFFLNFEEDLRFLNIFIIASTGFDESQYGTFCIPDEIVGGEHIKTCMGNLFSAFVF